MREICKSGSVEGVMGNHDSYSDTLSAGGPPVVQDSFRCGGAAAETDRVRNR